MTGTKILMMLRKAATCVNRLQYNMFCLWKQKPKRPWNYLNLRKHSALKSLVVRSLRKFVTSKASLVKNVVECGIIGSNPKECISARNVGFGRVCEAAPPCNLQNFPFNIGLPPCI